MVVKTTTAYNQRRNVCIGEPLGEPFGSLLTAWAAFFALHFSSVCLNHFFETFGALGATQDYFFLFWEKEGNQNRLPKASVQPPSSTFCFPQTSTFYVGKTHKCKKRGFPMFSKTYAEFIHTCTFYFGKTYKCAVTAFTI